LSAVKRFQHSRTQRIRKHNGAATTHNSGNNESPYNFFDLINKHRVEEVIRILNSTESKKLKLLSIAFDAGFNSKASFNRVFKKFTSKTPSEFS